MSNKDVAREKRIEEKRIMIQKAFKQWEKGMIAECELIVFVANIIGKTKDYDEKCALSAMFKINWKEIENNEI